MTLRTVVMCAAASAAACRDAPAASALPNLVFVLTDDLGYYAPGYANPRLHTPTLDALAADGLKLMSHYTYMFCAPSRGCVLGSIGALRVVLQARWMCRAFLTGRFPYKLSATRANYIPPTLLDGIDLGFTMLPARLREAGYYSVHVGKWHQGLYAFNYTPTARGFDESNGFLDGGEDHFTQQSFYGSICPGKDIWVNGATAPQFQGEYTAYRINDAAVSAVRAAATRPSQPLFMYVALHNTHAPLEAEPRYEALYPNVTYADERNFYAMISTVDDVVANLTRALKDTGLWNNTLFVWTTDNGSPVTVGGSNYPLRGSKASNWEGGVRTPAFVTGGLLPQSQRGSNTTGLVHIADWYATFCSLAGLDPVDPSPTAPTPIDAVDLWPFLSGSSPSPRTTVVLDHNMYGANTTGAIRVGRYKLLVGPQPYATWYGEYSPPAPPAPAPNASITACSLTQPCLFDVDADPTEHNDISGANPSIVSALLATFHSYDATYHPPKANPPEDKAGYCGAIKANGGYVGPWRQPAS